MKLIKIVDNDTKKCEVALNENPDENAVAYYKSIGFIEGEFEVGYNGIPYLKGFAPEKPIEISAIEIRSKRDQLLTASDWTQMPDSPLSQEQKTKWTQYRQYLRDIPQQDEFPNIEIKSFEEFQQEEE